MFRPLDHRNLNLDVPFLTGVVPTSENLCVHLWPRLADALEGTMAYAHVPDAASAIPLIEKEMRAGDAILVKGSNGIGLSRLVAALGQAARDGETN